jgi:hypothetical protein
MPDDADDPLPARHRIPDLLGNCDRHLGIGLVVQRHHIDLIPQQPA